MLCINKRLYWSNRSQRSGRSHGSHRSNRNGNRLLRFRTVRQNSLYQCFLRKKEEIRIYDERNIFIQKQIYSLHSLFSLVLLYVATLWAALQKPELLIPFLLLMLADVALLFLAAIYCNIRNSCE